MPDKYILGIDLGTSSLKAMIVNSRGKVLSLASESYQFDSPSNGYAEQDPLVWKNAFKKAFLLAAKKAEIKPLDIVSVGFSGQMHSLVMLDKNCKIVRPAILHCDSRSNKQKEYIESKLSQDQIREILCNRIYTGFMLPSLLWLRDEEPENFQKVHYVMSPKDYLKFLLSGEIVTDYCDASATLLFDIPKKSWSREILKIFNLDHIQLPKVKYAEEAMGQAQTNFAQELGLHSKTLIVSGGGDQLMQLVGNGVIHPGDACVNIGTSGQVSFQSEKIMMTSDLKTNLFSSFSSERWIVMGAIMNAGLCFNWIRNLLGQKDYKLVDQMVEHVAPGSDGLIFIPYLTGERTPHFNPNLSGAFLGLTPRTDQARMMRAVLEGVSFALLESMEIIENLGVKRKQLIASGGATSSRVWLQLQSDIYNSELKVTTVKEQAAFGAAISAAISFGLFQNFSEACQAWVQYEPELIIPDVEKNKKYLNYYDLYKEFYKTSAKQLETLTLLDRKI